MVGILCEKPSAARNFATALGGNKGTYSGEQYVIVAARGHLYEFVDPDKMVPKNLAAYYAEWNLANLPWNEEDFQWTYKKKKDADSALKPIKDVLSTCSEVVIATDVDPSGEGGLLACEILFELGIRGPFSRMYFMDEAPKSIQDAFKKRKKIASLQAFDEYQQAFMRSRWDYLSMQWTRIATKFAPKGMVLRQGRLKSAMIVLVGDQLKKLNEYQKVPFYQNRFKDENGVMYTNPDEPVFPKPDDVPKQYQQSAVVVDKKEMKSTPPKKLLDLAALSAILAGKGVKSKQVLSVYQQMYEAQVVSYPRTEDKVITPEQFQELLPLADKIAAVVGVDSALLTHRQLRSTHVKTGGAHGANRPGPNVPKSLSALEAQFGQIAPMIYELLAKSYLAMLAEDYEYEAQKGHVKDYPKFVGSTTVPKKLGWKAVFNADADDDEETSQGLGQIAKPFVYEGFPPKPTAPSMKWLMKELEKRDIGTGATRTSTYADVTANSSHQIFEDKRGKISMADCGAMSYMLLPKTYISDLEITKRVQDQMKDVANNPSKADAYLHEIQAMIQHDIDVVTKNAESMKQQMGDKFKDVIPKEKCTGMFNGKEISFTREYAGHRFTDDECARLLKGEEISVTGFVSQKGSQFAAKGILCEQEFKKHKYFGFKITSMLNADGSDKPAGADDAYVTGIWKKKQIRFKREWSGHKFTNDEIKDLLAGKEISFEAVSKKTGNKYTAKGQLAKQKWEGREFVGFKPDFN